MTTAAAAATAAPAFVPRAAFSIPSCVPKTYYLGHQASAVNKLKHLLPTVSLVLECRDFRLPLSTHNPVLDRALAGPRRVVVYTRADLGAADGPDGRAAVGAVGGPPTFFWEKHKPATTAPLLAYLREAAAQEASLTGLRALIVGMPNTGKSSLLNKLRLLGLGAEPESRNSAQPHDSTKARMARKVVRKVAAIGDQAGVTRKVSTCVRVLPDTADHGGVLVVDTPGIFPPHVADAETMIKVAAVQGIKTGLISSLILCDYLLYRWNLRDPSVYAAYGPPTNDVDELLAAVAVKHGKLRAGQRPDLRAAADALLACWRAGALGRYVLDDLTPAHLDAHARLLQDPQMSLSEAKKRHREMLRLGRNPS